MNIDGVNYTLTDLSRGKIKENFINENFISDFNNSVSFFDFSKDLPQNQPEENLFIENKNFTIFDQPKYIYNDGYIFSTLPYPYELVYKNGEYNIELVFPKIYDNLLPPKISAPNPYMDKKIKIKTKAKKFATTGPSPRSKVSKVMR
jgi:hypothetical protein